MPSAAIILLFEVQFLFTTLCVVVGFVVEFLTRFRIMLAAKLFPT
jgi:hypothetical protein